jgi:hypothetical protein
METVSLICAAFAVIALGVACLVFVVWDTRRDRQLARVVQVNRRLLAASRGELWPGGGEGRR